MKRTIGLKIAKRSPGQAERFPGQIAAAASAGHTTVLRVLGSMRIGERSLAYGLLRVAFGVNFAGHGMVRIYHGAGQFASTTAGHLAGSPLPHGLVYGFGLAIPWIEALLGLSLILGLLTRVALVGGSAFMMALTVGVTANQQWDVAGQQLVYSLVFFLLLFLMEYNVISVDGALGRTRIE